MSTEGAIADVDLFGLDPNASPLALYAPDRSRGDIYADAPAAVARKWDSFARAISASSGIEDYLRRHVEDLGLGYRLTGDEQERPWPLNPMPVIIGADEWQRLEDGLIQRAELLERVIADIYGPQRLVTDGHLPAPVVTGSRDFTRKMVGVPPPAGRYLHVYGVDLARGPTGEWRVLADRVRLSFGIGYALENRIALSRGTGSLLPSIGARRLADFFDAMRRGIASTCAREDPRIALLTPGRFNQAYPEQAHLARYLGFALVEGRDLLVQDSKLFVRTIAGLKRVDALWRWINARNLDPLAFDSRSEIGVPDLFSAWADGGLVTANWPGAGVIEARAMSAFLPRLAEVLFGEPLMLPNLSTWWCGQEWERDYVAANLDTLMVSSAFREPVEGLEDGRTRPGSGFTGAAREALLQAMARRPMDYTGQEVIRIGTTPCWTGAHFEPRGFTIRTFLARDEDGRWRMMPGGLARLSQAGELRTPLMGEGDLSADVCVVDEVPGANVAQAHTPSSPAIRRAAKILPSQAADNLFWLGRYSERAQMTARVVRALLSASSMQSAQQVSETVPDRLARLLARWGVIETAEGTPEELAAAALGDVERCGSLAGMVDNVRQIARLLRDRLFADSWRVINRPMPGFLPLDSDSMADAAERVMERFATLSGITAESMSRTAAWRFLDMGVRLERASLSLQATLEMVPGSASADDLTSLLDLFDCHYLYRNRYLAIPFIAPALDMVLLDPDQPRGLAFQVQQLADHIAALPTLRANGMPEPPMRAVRQIAARIAALDAEELDHDALEELLEQVLALSDAIAKRYFLQREPQAGRADKPSIQ
ncbi:MAG: circularly permuted type 2 ATP-grasp protein [Novosphingobium sp.]|nr:circularly permuted type 2 ATP-grasp protein [Novosphingobium sp.]